MLSDLTAIATHKNVSKYRNALKVSNQANLMIRLPASYFLIYLGPSQAKVLAVGLLCRQLNCHHANLKVAFVLQVQRQAQALAEDEAELLSTVCRGPV